MLTYRMSKFLKERRKELGKELKEIASITRIKGAYLKSIEEEEFDKLPVEVYTKGYIREYSEFLGIPSEIALEPYENYLREKKAGKEKDATDENAAAVLTREVVDNYDVHKGIDLEHMDLLLSPEVTSRSYNKTLFFKMLWILPAIAVGVAAYFFISFPKSAPQVDEQVASSHQVSPPPPPVALNPQPPPVLSRTPDSNAGVKVIRLPEPNKSQEMRQSQKDSKDKPPAISEKAQSKGEKSAAPKWKHTLNIDATDRVWIRVLIDGNENKEMMLNHGDKVSYGANKSFAVIVGNAAGANIHFDGKPFEKLGGKGEVVKFDFPGSGVQPPAAREKDPNAASEKPLAPMPSRQEQDNP